MNSVVTLLTLGNLKRLQRIVDFGELEGDGQLVGLLGVIIDRWRWLRRRENHWAHGFEFGNARFLGGFRLRKKFLACFPEAGFGCEDLVFRFWVSAERFDITFG